MVDFLTANWHAILTKCNWPNYCGQYNKRHRRVQSDDAFHNPRGRGQEFLCRSDVGRQFQSFHWNELHFQEVGVAKTCKIPDNKGRCVFIFVQYWAQIYLTYKYNVHVVVTILEYMYMWIQYCGSWQVHSLSSSHVEPIIIDVLVVTSTSNFKHWYWLPFKVYWLWTLGKRKYFTLIAQCL